MFRVKIFIMAWLIFLVGVAGAQQKIYKTTRPLPLGRQMYGSVVLGDYIYVIGGTRDQEPKGYTNVVEMARVNSDGALGPWEQTTSLPANRSYIDNTTLALNDIVYIVGGLDGIKDQNVQTILWTRPGSDGHLEQWRTSLPHPGQGVSCSTAVATPGYIHLIGGTVGERTPTDRVWSARVSTDGSIMSWKPGPPLPMPLWYHSAGVAGGRVWVWGGLTASSPDSVNQVIFKAPILASGKIGAWQRSSSQLPVGFYGSTCSVSGAYLLSFCPRYAGSVISNDVWFAAVNNQGALSQWTKLSSDISAKVYLGVATDYRRGFVYLPGGRYNREDYTYDKNVYYFKLASKKSTQTAESASQYTGASGASESRLSYMQIHRKPLSRIPGFQPYERARAMDQPAPKCMVLYFNSEKARKCKEQEEILKTFDTAPFADRIVFAELDTLNYPQIAQQYGVFRIPYWIFFDANQNVRHKTYGVLQKNVLENYLRQLAQ